MLMRDTTLTRLFVVPKRTIPSATSSHASADRVLQQLAALDRARDAVQQLCRRLTRAAESATKLHTKIQHGTDDFIAAWNGAHPQQTIQRCRGVESNPACLRYTLNLQGRCDACRQ